MHLCLLAFLFVAEFPLADDARKSTKIVISLIAENDRKILVSNTNIEIRKSVNKGKYCVEVDIRNYNDSSVNYVIKQLSDSGYRTSTNKRTLFISWDEP